MIEEKNRVEWKTENHKDTLRQILGKLREDQPIMVLSSSFGAEEIVLFMDSSNNLIGFICNSSEYFQYMGKATLENLEYIFRDATIKDFQKIEVELIFSSLN